MDSANLISAKDPIASPAFAMLNAGSKELLYASASQSAYRRLFFDATDSIRSELEQVEATLLEELDHPNPCIREILHYVAEFGGKRLRPCLTLLAAQASGSITDETIRLAAVSELVHTATLLHDDILDNASMRRHRTAVHVNWTVPTSILAGDWIFAQAYALANRSASTLPGRWIADAAKQVCEGEMLQGMSIRNFDLKESEYIKLLENKTGALCAVSCSLGAWSGGGDESNCYRLQQFGLKLGTAFQIMDDWLDVWGNTDNAGKTLGTDLRSFKPTMPTLRTLSLLPIDERVELIRHLNQGDEGAAHRLCNCMNESDASTYTTRFAERLVHQAIQCVDPLPNSMAKVSLQALAQLACHRNK